MLFLLESLAPWVAAALALGVVCGLIASGAAAGRGGKLWGVVAVLIFCCGVVAAVLDLAPGEYGLWLESGLAIGAGYGAGGFAGCLLRRSFKKSAAMALESPGSAVIDQGRTLETLAAQTAIEVAEASPAPEPSAAMAPESAKTSAEMAAHKSSERPSRAVKPEPADEDLRLVHGLDRKSGQALQELGVNGLAGLAALTRARQAEFASLLGTGEAVMFYWVAQARLLVQGVPTGFAQHPDETESGLLDSWTADALSASLPQTAPPQAQDKFYPGARPLGLLSPPGGGKDALGRVAGIDQAAEKTLNALGIWTFRQIAAWTPDNCRWIDSYLAAPGRIARERWVEQAAALAGAPIGVGPA